MFRVLSLCSELRRIVERETCRAVVKMIRCWTFVFGDRNVVGTLVYFTRFSNDIQDLKWSCVIFVRYSAHLYGFIGVTLCVARDRLLEIWRDTGRAILDLTTFSRYSTVKTFPKRLVGERNRILKELEFRRPIFAPVTHRIFRATALLYYPCHWLESPTDQPRIAK